MAIERIYGTDQGKQAFIKTDNNFQKINQQIENLSTPPAWINATLQNGWDGTFQYRKNQIGQLEVYLYLYNGTIANGTNIVKLPSSYWPITSTPIPVYDTMRDTLGGIFLLGKDGTLSIAKEGNIESGYAYRGSGVAPC